MGAFLRPTEERKAAAGIVPAVEEVALPEIVEIILQCPCQQGSLICFGHANPLYICGLCP